MLNLKEIIDNELLESNFINLLPIKCECGSDIEFTESLTEIKCTNKICPYNISKRLYDMLNNLGLTYWSEQDCIDLVIEHNFTTPFQILLIKQLYDNNIQVNLENLDRRVNDIENIKNREIELWKIVEIANIRYISTLANKLFSSYDDFESAYEDIDRGQISFISDKLGIMTNESTAIAIKVYNDLLNYREELMFAETQFNIRKHKSNPIRIAIAGNVPGYLNKTSFIKMLNNLYYEFTTFVLDSTISKNTNILIADMNKSTKYRTAVRINEEYISQGIHDGEFSLDEVDKFRKVTDLTKIGEKIAICNEKELLNRLDKHFNTSKSKGR